MSLSELVVQEDIGKQNRTINDQISRPPENRCSNLHAKLNPDSLTTLNQCIIQISKCKVQSAKPEPTMGSSAKLLKVKR